MSLRFSEVEWIIPAVKSADDIVEPVPPPAVMVLNRRWMVPIPFKAVRSRYMLRAYRGNASFTRNSRSFNVRVMTEAFWLNSSMVMVRSQWWTAKFPSSGVWFFKLTKRGFVKVRVENKIRATMEGLRTAIAMGAVSQQEDEYPF